MRAEAIPTKASGLYFIGTTTFNPYTDEKYYWVKVGLSSCLSQRMRSYATQTPTTFYIDFLEIAKEDDYRALERCCHALLEIYSSIGDADNRARGSKEWYQVSKEEYLKISELGFKYFNSMKIGEDDLKTLSNATSGTQRKYTFILERAKEILGIDYVDYSILEERNLARLEEIWNELFQE